MGRIALGVVLALAVGWLMFGRGDDAAAVTDCLTDAGASVEECVEEYPELDGPKFYSVRYGSHRAILFIGKGDEASTAFESTLASLVQSEGQTMSTRRSGRALLVWERETYAPELNACLP